MIHSASTSAFALPISVLDLRLASTRLDTADSPELCSANLAPTRSECLRNLSVQLSTHVVCK